ncbi:MAG: hypothetical protein JWO86_6754 [Myxococcaceae bacterium]|jgi:hypothetical protein|nr:hypothetical protein [Myxococcaceae bacterium]MEA2747829.1 hypothetical protein [Myxococcales bacterium]
MVTVMREKKCACGHTRGHPEVAQDAEYTLWGWIQLSMLGITPLPERIVFRCRRCGKSLGVSRDPALLRKRGMPDAPAPSPPKDAAVTEAAPTSNAKDGASPL